MDYAESPKPDEEEDWLIEMSPNPRLTRFICTSQLPEDGGSESQTRIAYKEVPRSRWPAGLEDFEEDSVCPSRNCGGEGSAG